MTQSEFEKKLEAAAMNDGDYYYPFVNGARWAREETLREVFEALRGAGDVIHDKTGLCVASKEWANWLEKRFE